MKKLSFFTVLLFSCFNCFAQFSTFEPYIKETRNSATSSNAGEMIRTTGYILTETGSISKRIQLKVLIQTTEIGESVYIKSYNNVIPGFGSNWERVSVKAQAIGGQSPTTEQQTVAYDNFTYWAYWSGDKIWFN